MKYRATAVCHWPCGALRALSGQVFDGFDGVGMPAAVRARSLMRFCDCVPADRDAEIDAPEAPEAYRDLVPAAPKKKDRKMPKAKTNRKAL